MSESKRTWVEPSDKNKPGWVVPKADVANLPPCEHCKQSFKLDGAGGVSGGLVIVYVGAEGKEYYHGYPRPGNDCLSKAGLK